MSARPDPGRPLHIVPYGRAPSPNVGRQYGDSEGHVVEQFVRHGVIPVSARVVWNQSDVRRGQMAHDLGVIHPAAEHDVTPQPKFGRQFPAQTLRSRFPGVPVSPGRSSR